MSAGPRLGAPVSGTTIFSTMWSPAGEPMRRRAGLSSSPPGDAFLARPETPILYQADREGPLGILLGGVCRAQRGAAAGSDLFHPHPPRAASGGGGSGCGRRCWTSTRPGAQTIPVPCGWRAISRRPWGFDGDGPPRGGEALTVYARQGAAFLQQNYSRSIGVDEAARQAGVSRSCLYRAFQAEFGCSPSAYLIRYRIQRATQLLRHSALPISAVAASVGFEDPLYFSRAFRRAVGQSPTEYRRQNGPPQRLKPTEAGATPKNRSRLLLYDPLIRQVFPGNGSVGQPQVVSVLQSHRLDRVPAVQQGAGEIQNPPGLTGGVIADRPPERALFQCLQRGGVWRPHPQ